MPFAEPLHGTLAFVSRRGSPLSPATRELIVLAEQQLEAFVKRTAARR